MWTLLNELSLDDINVVKGMYCMQGAYIRNTVSPI
jgi:hypothetical protein